MSYNHLCVYRQHRCASTLMSFYPVEPPPLLRALGGCGQMQVADSVDLMHLLLRQKDCIPSLERYRYFMKVILCRRYRPSLTHKLYQRKGVCAIIAYRNTVRQGLWKLHVRLMRRKVAAASAVLLELLQEEGVLQIVFVYYCVYRCQ